MQLRIKTLYRRKMSTIINVLWGVEIFAAAAIGIVTTYSIEGNIFVHLRCLDSSESDLIAADLVRPSTVGLMHVCTVTRFPAYAAAFWLPVLLFEIFLFVLAFRIAWYNHHQLGSWHGARLLHVVLRDNFSFFVLYVIVISTVGYPLIDRFFLLVSSLHIYWPPLSGSSQALNTFLCLLCCPALLRPLWGADSSSIFFKRTIHHAE